MVGRNVKAGVVQVPWLFSVSVVLVLSGDYHKLRKKGYSFQCFTLFGCCIKQKKRKKNSEISVNIVPTCYQQVTNKLPTSYQHIIDYQPTVGCLSSNCQLTNGQQLTDSQPTGFSGNSSLQLPN